MKTLLFCTAWADSTEAMANRVGRWFTHHGSIPYPCPVELAVIADGIAPGIRWPDGAYYRANLEPHLGRPSHLDYPGWWRSFGHAAKVARELGCQRIWHVESDFFLASHRMVNKMNEIERGWVVFWCARHGFPETAVQVIAEEYFGKLSKMERDYHSFRGRHAEHILPFTTVIRDMVGDRYGELGVMPETIADLDYYGQCPGNIPMIFS